MPSFWQLFTKSIWLDWEFLRIYKLSLGFRISFILRKNLAAAQLILSKKAKLKINSEVTFSLSNLNDLGTLQTVIWDFYQTIVIFDKIIDKTNPVIIDVGGNIGQFSLAAKLFSPKSKLITFEPDPNVFEQLTKHLKNLDIRFKNLALSNQQAKLKFYRQEVSLVSTLEKPSAGEKFEEIKVDCTTGDQALSEYDQIDLLKIDVEGHEYAVIEGLLETLQKTAYLLVEISLQRQAEPNNLDLLTLVKKICPNSKILRTGRVLHQITLTSQI